MCSLNFHLGLQREILGALVLMYQLCMHYNRASYCWLRLMSCTLGNNSKCPHCATKGLGFACMNRPQPGFSPSYQSKRATWGQLAVKSSSSSGLGGFGMVRWVHCWFWGRSQQRIRSSKEHYWSQPSRKAQCCLLLQLQLTTMCNNVECSMDILQTQLHNNVLLAVLWQGPVLAVFQNGEGSRKAPPV